MTGAKHRLPVVHTPSHRPIAGGQGNIGFNRFRPWGRAINKTFNTLHFSQEILSDSSDLKNKQWVYNDQSQCQYHGNDKHINNGWHERCVKSYSVNLPHYCSTIRKAVDIAICHKWYPVLIIFAILYTPFLLEYGWEYRNTASIDLPSFYSAGVQVFRHNKSPYDREALQLVMEQDASVHPYLYPPQVFEHSASRYNREALQAVLEQGLHVHPYLYPPPSLLFFYPLSLIEYSTARRLVLLGNHLLILALLFVIPFFLFRASSETRFPLVFLLTIVYILSFYPIVSTLYHGQINMLLLAFILAYWLFARAKHPVTASLFLALAIFLKTYPLIILPMLLVSGRRREFAFTAAWLGFGTVLALLIIPSGIWLDWFLNVLPTGGYTRIPDGLFSPASNWNQNLNGFFARTFTENPWSPPLVVSTGLARTLTYTAAGLVIAISNMAVFRASRIHPVSLDRTMLVALPTMYLVAPFSWEHHLVYLLPSILMLLAARSRLLLPKTLLFYSTSIGAAMLVGLDRGLHLKFYGVIVLWLLCIFAACSKRIQLPNTGVENDG